MSKIDFQTSVFIAIDHKNLSHFQASAFISNKNSLAWLANISKTKFMRFSFLHHFSQIIRIIIDDLVVYEMQLLKRIIFHKENLAKRTLPP